MYRIYGFIGIHVCTWSYFVFVKTPKKNGSGDGQSFSIGSCIRLVRAYYGTLWHSQRKLCRDHNRLEPGQLPQLWVGNLAGVDVHVT